MNRLLLALLFGCLSLRPCLSKPLDILEQFIFQEETTQKPSSFPVPCEDGKNFCGEDESKYLSKEFIESVLKSNSKVRNWINEMHVKNSSVDEKSSIIPACHSRREKFPSFGRAENIKNQWRYIIELSQITNHSSNAEILICEKPGEACQNDGDSPKGEGTTVCIQAYRNQRLLAMDEKGETSVDSFRLPSGCICHYRQNDPALRTIELPESALRTILRPRTQFQPEICPDNSQISLNHERNRRSDDRIFFPDHSSEDLNPESNSDELDDLAPRSQDLEEVPMEELEVPPCPNDEDFCELLPSYPKKFVDGAVIKSHGGLDSDEFNLYHSPICQPQKTTLRIGDIPNGEYPLCDSVPQIMHPQKGRNIYGIWRHIVNTDIYKQGVSIEKCSMHSKGKSCLYGGDQGIYPEATACKQQYSKHPFVVISSNGHKSIELFKIPTACVCHIENSTLFK